MSAVAGWALFVPLRGPALRAALLAYGAAMGLTFDEFGMWLHLGGGYWQRASYDAVVSVAAVFGLFAFAPAYRRWRSLHWMVAVLVLASILVLGGLMVERIERFGTSMGPWLEQLERDGPT